MGTIKTTNIEPIANNGTVTLGSSGDTFTVPSGVTVNMSSATQTGVGGTNTPAFHAYLSSNQSVSNNVLTKVAANTEIYDTDNCYDNSSNYRFTPTVAGKYYVYASLSGSTSDYKLYFSIPKIYKNGSEIANISNTFGSGAVYAVDSFVAVVADMNGSSDYLEFFGIVDIHTNLNESFLGGSMSKTAFGAYRLIT